MKKTQEDILEMKAQRFLLFFKRDTGKEQILRNKKLDNILCIN